ncbi:MAG: PD-(D/E)XK motif protein [Clostridiales bacterium]|nr:PD-(D/E)XK motif protein [Clostridiales bacterium]
MINFQELFNALSQPNANHKRIPVESALGVFYGLSNDGYLRLSFLSKLTAPKLESTKLLRVTQGEESKGVYWTCFDLLQNDAKSVFYTFCENMVLAVADINIESNALSALKKRFVIWKTMFKQIQASEVSREVIQGLFGELYFLKNFMLEKYSPNESVNGWSGADSKSKDYTINNEWYEIKTIGANTNKIQISSLSQLSSPVIGHLVVIKVESVSEEFSGQDSSINILLSNILAKIQDEITEEHLLKKIKSVVGNISDKVLNSKFVVKSVDFYLVDDNFPRLQEKDIPYTEIEEVTYSINVNAIKKYKES